MAQNCPDVVLYFDLLQASEKSGTKTDNRAMSAITTFQGTLASVRLATHPDLDNARRR